jgi:hypothetical protein
MLAADEGCRRLASVCAVLETMAGVKRKSRR